MEDLRIIVLLDARHLVEEVEAGLPHVLGAEPLQWRSEAGLPMCLVQSHLKVQGTQHQRRQGVQRFRGLSDKGARATTHLEVGHDNQALVFPGGGGGGEDTVLVGLLPEDLLAEDSVLGGEGADK